MGCAEEIAAIIDSLPRRELLVSPVWGPYFRYQQKIGRLPAEPGLKIVTNAVVPRNQIYIIDPRLLEEIK